MYHCAPLIRADRGLLWGSSGLENKGKKGRCTDVRFLGGSRRKGEVFTRTPESNRRRDVLMRCIHSFKLHAVKTGRREFQFWATAVGAVNPLLSPVRGANRQTGRPTLHAASQPRERQLVTVLFIRLPFSFFKTSLYGSITPRRRFLSKYRT